MNIIGGRSSRYHEAGISTNPVHDKSMKISMCQAVWLIAFGDLTGHRSANQGFHPSLWMLFEVDLLPAVTGPQPIALTIMVRERMVVLQAILQHQLCAFLRRLPPRRNNPSWCFTMLKVRDQPITFVHDSSLLLQRHFLRILVRVAMETDFVAGVNDHSAFRWEGFQRVSGNEPRCGDTVLLEHLQKSLDANGASEQSSADVGGGVFTSIRSKPSGNCVDVD